MDQSKKILIADDEPEYVSLVTEVLESDGYAVVTAGDGASALRLATSDPPDLILLDIGLPALPGNEVLEQLKARRVPTRVIMFSGRDSAKDVVRFVSLGAADYIIKPLRPRELLEAVKRVLEVVPTLDVLFGDPKEVNVRLLAENVELKHSVAKLQQRLAALGSRTSDQARRENELRRVRKERSGLEKQLVAVQQALEVSRGLNERRSRQNMWIGAGIKVGYFVVAVAGTGFLVWAGIVPKTARVLWTIPLLITLLLSLPLDRAIRFSAKVLKSEAHVQMEKDDRPHTSSSDGNG